jgi:uncharacterized protein YecT (DUF1311 family)
LAILPFVIAIAFLQFSCSLAPKGIAGKWISVDSDKNPADQLVYKFSEDSNHKINGAIIDRDEKEKPEILSDVNFDQGKLHYKWDLSLVKDTIDPTLYNQLYSVAVFNGIMGADGMTIIGQTRSGVDNIPTTLVRLLPDPRIVDLQDKVDKGNGLSMAQLGYRYYYGDGVPFDLVKAESLFRQAADKGIPNDLCLNWYFGIGFDKDFKFAYKLFSLLNAYDYLAFMKYEGLGTPQDIKGANKDFDDFLNDKKLIAKQQSPDVYAFYEPEDKDGLIYIPSELNEMESLSERMEKGKPTPYNLTVLNPPVLRCVADESEGDDAACTYQSDKLTREKLFLLVKKALSGQNKEVKTTFADYEQKFRDLQEKSTLGIEFVYGRATMGPLEETVWRSSYEEEHLDEVQKILQKKLEYKLAPIDLKTADIELNKHYQILLKKADDMVINDLNGLKGDPSDTSDVFKISERAWIAYRDSAIKLISAIYKDDPNKNAVIERYKIDATLAQTKTIESYFED